MKNLTKTEFQKRFRFIMMLATLALFIGIVLPAYYNFSDNNAGLPQKAIMMWSVVFGTGKGAIGARFSFSWVGFMPFVLAFVIIVIWLGRTFLSVEATEKGKETGSFALDVANLVLSIVILAMFIILPISLARSDVYLINYWANNLAWSAGYIYLYIICIVMIVSSVFVLYADIILKLLNKEKKNS